MRGGYGRGAALLTVSYALFLGSSYLLQIWLGRHLEPWEYGAYAIVINLLTALNVIQNAGLPQALARRLVAEPEREDELLRSTLALQLLLAAALTAVLILVAAPLAALLGRAELATPIRLSALVLPPYALLSVYMTGYYNGLHRFGRQALLITVYSMLKTVAVVALAYMFRVTGAVLGFALAPVATLLFGIKLPRSLRGPRVPYGPLLRFGLPVTLFAVLSTLLISVDLLFVEALVETDADAGHYAAAQNAARIPYYGLTGLSTVLFPAVTRSLRSGTRVETRAVVQSSLRTALRLLVPATLLISARAPELLVLLYDARYLPAAPALAILVLALGFVTLLTVLANVLHGLGRPALATVLAGAGLAATCLLCAVFTTHLGLPGAALGTLGGAALASGAVAVAVRRLIGPYLSLASTGRILAAALVAYGLARLVPASGATLLALYSGCSVLYLALLLLTGEVTRAEVRGALATLRPRPVRAEGSHRSG